MSYPSYVEEDPAWTDVAHELRAESQGYAPGSLPFKMGVQPSSGLSLLALAATKIDAIICRRTEFTLMNVFGLPLSSFSMSLGPDHEDSLQSSQFSPHHRFKLRHAYVNG